MKEVSDCILKLTLAEYANKLITLNTNNIRYLRKN